MSEEVKQPLPEEPVPEEAEPVPEEQPAEENLQELLAKAQAESADYKDKWMRSAAEFDNFRKRNEATRQAGKLCSSPPSFACNNFIIVFFIGH